MSSQHRDTLWGVLLHEVSRSERNGDVGCPSIYVYMRPCPELGGILKAFGWRSSHSRTEEFLFPLCHLCCQYLLVLNQFWSQQVQMLAPSHTTSFQNIIILMVSPVIVCIVCVCVHMHAGLHLLGRAVRRPDVDIRCLLQLLSTLYREVGFLTWTQNSCVHTCLAGQLALEILYLFPKCPRCQTDDPTFFPHKHMTSMWVLRIWAQILTFSSCLVHKAPDPLSHLLRPFYMHLFPYHVLAQLSILVIFQYPQWYLSDLSKTI